MQSCTVASLQRASRLWRCRWWPQHQDLTGKCQAAGMRMLACIHQLRLGCRQVLSDTLAREKLCWVTITSPEAAAVFLEAWSAAGHPQVPSLAPGYRAKAIRC